MFSWLVVAPPFGVMPGAAPALPLPAKITMELGPVIDWRDEHGPRCRRYRGRRQMAVL